MGRSKQKPPGRRQTGAARPGADERGVLIVMVLAFVAVLLVVIVGFHAYIRGEAVAASNMTGSTQARMVALTGLEATLRAIHKQEETYVSFPLGGL